MKPWPRDLLDQLDLEAALTAEVDTRRNLIPEEPGLPTLAPRAEQYADWLKGQLLAGANIPRNSVLYARKHGHGVRPVPIVSIAGRVVYRALVKLILGDRSPVDRSPETYLTFVSAPIDYAHERAGGGIGWLLGDSDISHVVKTDITAFYQYVDHSLLQRELMSFTSDFAAVSALIEVLSIIEGRAFGLPQLLDPSDDLSDVYADIIERALIREGFPTWRFNDDFRIACESYSDALAAIEALGRHAGDLGLVISEHKTFTPRYTTYVLDTLGLTVDQPMPEGTTTPPPEEAVADYVAPDPQIQLQDAVGLLNRIGEPGQPTQDGEINLLDLRADEFRDIRRALRVLTREANPSALDRGLHLAIYAPAITPELCGYLSALDPQDITPVVDKVIERVSLSDWQAIWFTNVIRSARLVDERRATWLRERCFNAPEPGLKAEATLTLSIAGLINYEEVELLLRTEPEVFRPWYLSAIAELSVFPVGPSAHQLAAVRRGSREDDLLMP